MRSRSPSGKKDDGLVADDRATLERSSAVRGPSAGGRGSGASTGRSPRPTSRPGRRVRPSRLRDAPRPTRRSRGGRPSRSPTPPPVPCSPKRIVFPSRERSDTTVASSQERSRSARPPVVPKPMPSRTRPSVTRSSPAVFTSWSARRPGLRARRRRFPRRSTAQRASFGPISVAVNQDFVAVRRPVEADRARPVRFERTVIFPFRSTTLIEPLSSPAIGWSMKATRSRRGDADVADPALGLVQDLLDRVLEAVPPLDDAAHREVAPVGREVGVLDVGQDLPRRASDERDAREGPARREAVDVLPLERDRELARRRDRRGRPPAAGRAGATRGFRFASSESRNGAPSQLAP